MFASVKTNLLLLLGGISLVVADTTTSNPSSGRPDLLTPDLTEIRAILANLEAPIISTLVSRAALPVDSSLYANQATDLITYLIPREAVASVSGRFDYGTLEYPFTLSPVAADKTTSSTPFPPGRFHQDTFTPNSNITSFYVNTLIPLIKLANAQLATPPATTSSVFFHLINSSTPDADAALNLDATLLALLSHRASIGKIVAESKYQSNVTAFTPLIKANNADEIRVLLTNIPQQNTVLSQAANDSSAIATVWETAQGATNPTAFVAAIQNATAQLYNELIEITTQVEIEYILARLI